MPCACERAHGAQRGQGRGDLDSVLDDALHVDVTKPGTGKEVPDHAAAFDAAGEAVDRPMRSETEVGTAFDHVPNRPLGRTAAARTSARTPSKARWYLDHSKSPIERESSRDRFTASISTVKTRRMI